MALYNFKQKNALYCVLSLNILNVPASQRDELCHYIFYTSINIKLCQFTLPFTFCLHNYKKKLCYLLLMSTDNNVSEEFCHDNYFLPGYYATKCQYSASSLIRIPLGKKKICSDKWKIQIMEYIENLLHKVLVMHEYL